MEAPPSYLESQMDESLSSQPLLEDKAALNSLLRTLLHGRTARSSFQFQPQRFGRDERGSMLGDGRIHSRGWDSAPQFWSMAVPQRFGRKK
ncbi:pro-FMRFamide-related neuropeptide FF [Hyperolius riggenbachi]|uniref:pro-FMRFamide-related neuropeptide FF n=1 Tax=Hyperolius riggenbachi TaxID=752182 RepID=UPI0035A2DBF3